MTRKIVAIQLNLLETLNFQTDTSWLIIYELLQQNFSVFIYTPSNLFYLNGEVTALGHFIQIHSYLPAKYELSARQSLILNNTKAVIIRQDPPFNMEYITATYLLELIKDSTLIINNPTEIRNYPEKLSVLHFPNFTPPTLIASNNLPEIMEFITHHQKVVIKPLYSFGGTDVRTLSANQPTLSDHILYYLKTYGNFILQKYIPSITMGDKRVILLDGEILGAIHRTPKDGDFRTNLAAGGSAQTCILTPHEIEICNSLKPELKKRGLILVGLDIIERYLLEINVTSPTGLVIINKLYNTNTEVAVVNYIENYENSM